MLVNDALSGGHVKGRLLGFGASVHKEVVAILPKTHRGQVRGGANREDEVT